MRRNTFLATSAAIGLLALGQSAHAGWYSSSSWGGSGSYLTNFQTSYSDKETQLGDKLFHDTNLSEPAGQACASCHTDTAGFADPDQNLPVSEGVISGLFGGRNAPTAGYAMYSPILFNDAGTWTGGMFWDGRAHGGEIAVDKEYDPLAHQALGPFLNPVEMANPAMYTVVRDAYYSNYQDLMVEVCGAAPRYLKYLRWDNAEVEDRYHCISRSIAAYERLDVDFGAFTSKYDRYLEKCIDLNADVGANTLATCADGSNNRANEARRNILSDLEWAGLQEWMGPNNNNGVKEAGEGANCVACHVADWTTTADHTFDVQVPQWAKDLNLADAVPPMFTDFTFDNLGIPANTEIHRLTGNSAKDLGLGGFLATRPDLLNGTNAADENGKFKVSTIRNVEKNAPYGHNGLFQTLEEITAFYDDRDPTLAEVPETVNTDEVGNLGLSAQDEKEIVAFMKALTDGYEPPATCSSNCGGDTGGNTGGNTGGSTGGSTGSSWSLLSYFFSWFSWWR